MAGITLRSANILVGEQVLHGVKVGAELYLQRCIGMAEGVERDVLGDAGALDPFLQWMVELLYGESGEHLALRAWLDQLERLVADGHVIALLSLLADEVEVETAVGILADFIPVELDDVAASQSCQARKERSTTDDLLLARCLAERLQLGQCQ